MAEKKKKAKNSLTPKQKKFGDEFLIDLNGTKAAIRAGYSEKNADKIASQLLDKTRVREYIEGRMKGLEEKTGITQEKVLKELAAVAFADVTDYAQIIEKPLEIIDEGQTFTLKMQRCVEPVLTKNLTETQRKALASIKEGRNGIEIKTHDKLKALQMLGDYLSLFTDKERLSIERRRLELEEERLELEKKKVAAVEPDKEMTVVIKGFDEGWCD